MTRLLVLAGVGVVLALGVAGVAFAQSGQGTTPSGFNYEIKDGKRVPRADNKTVAADGTVREEYRSGKCVTVKEKRPDGAVKTSQKCD